MTNWFNYSLAKFVKTLPDYKLKITFINDQTKIYDCKKLLNYKVYEKLKNKTFFDTVKVESGIISWSELIDLAPEEVYHNSI